MSFRRGLMFGFLAGAIGAAMSRLAPAVEEGASVSDEAAPTTRLGKARAAGRGERQAAEQRLRERYDAARRSGHLPSDET